MVDCEVGGIAADRLTRGHRFHSDGDIVIDGVDDYAAKLRAAHVIVDHAERQDLIRTAAKAAAAAEGLTLVEDEGLVIENAGLTEWPVPLLGRFDESYLEVPPEVIQLTARTNQKYFVCEANGKLANAFVCTANIAAADGGTAIVAGNRKVLAARLSDASFFWQQDRKTKLSDQAKKLERITFHEKLGTVADKVARVAKLAEWLASEGIVPNCDPALARQAAELCKADLVTEMVGEFPELQGLMGGYYARAEGLPDAVADAIRDHYKPVGQGDEVPTAPVTVAVALADKLDTLLGFFVIGEVPTGSKDPYALRRAAISVLNLMLQNCLKNDLLLMLRRCPWEVPGLKPHPEEDMFGRYIGTLGEFFVSRFAVMIRDAGHSQAVVRAVANAQDFHPHYSYQLAEALSPFISSDDGKILLESYRRVSKILDGQVFPMLNVISSNEPAEQALISAMNNVEPLVDMAISNENYVEAMTALAFLRSPINNFFDQLMVNVDDVEVRMRRLSILSRFRAAVHKVADFSRIEG